MTAPIIPDNISFVDWCNVIRNEYPTEPIPIVYQEHDWKLFYNMLLSNRAFENKFLPDSRMFNNWRNWASEFLLSVGT